MLRFFGLAMLIAAGSMCAAQANEVTTVTMGFESQLLDLETGAVVDSSNLVDPSDADIRLAYNALRPTKAIVIPETGTETASSWQEYCLAFAESHGSVGH